MSALSNRGSTDRDAAAIIWWIGHSVESREPAFSPDLDPQDRVPE